MILLAFELSTRRPSIALAEDDRVLAEQSWEASQNNLPHLFEALETLLKTANGSLDQVDVFVVGRGPGAFTGIRIAITAARSLALPKGKRVFALSSGEVIAYEAAQQQANEKILVIGDARRGQLWAGTFVSNKLEKDWCIIKPEDLATMTSEKTVIATPDKDRLHPHLFPLPLRERMKGEGFLSVFPTARTLAVLAHQKITQHISSEPLEPLYLTSAV